MKAIVSTFLPICIFSFIAFGISVAVLGFESSTASAALGSETTVISDSYTNIEILSGGVNVSLYASDRSDTVIYADRSILGDVCAQVNGDTLVIDCNRTIDSIKDIFSFGNEMHTVEIAVPAMTYNTVQAQVNAGTTKILNVAAYVLDLKLNAGDLTYSAPEGYVTPSLTAEVNAGNCTIYNAASEIFSLELNAGNMDVYGLSGNGDIDSSAGNLTANFSRLDGDLNLDVSAGNIDLNLPVDISAQIECDATAGEVSVKHSDTRESLDDGDTVVIADGTYGIICNLTAGSVNITDNVKLKSAPAIPSAPAVEATETAPVVTSVTAEMAVAIDKTA